jgi:anti-anti-sigma regulatory factor
MIDRKPLAAWTEFECLNEDESRAAHGAPEMDLFGEAWANQSREWSTPVERVSTVHDIALVRLEGEIGIPEFHAVESLVDSLAEKGFHKFVFSFAAVEHLNYRVFQHLMHIAKHLRLRSGDLRFTEISPYLFHIFLFVGADQTIDYFTSVEEAILSFHNTHGRHWH